MENLIQNSDFMVIFKRFDDGSNGIFLVMEIIIFVLEWYYGDNNFISFDIMRITIYVKKCIMEIIIKYRNVSGIKCINDGNGTKYFFYWDDRFL